MIVNSKVSFSIDGETFGKGEHVLDKEVTSHWYFGALVLDGSIEILKEDEDEEPLIFDENSKAPKKTKASKV